MGPDDGAARIGIGWFQKMRATELAITFGREVGNNHVAILIEQEVAIAIGNDKALDQRTFSGTVAAIVSQRRLPVFSSKPRSSP